MSAHALISFVRLAIASRARVDKLAAVEGEQVTIHSSIFENIYE